MPFSSASSRTMLEGLTVVFGIAVTEVHADDVQAGVHHAAQDFRAAAGRTDGGNDLGGSVKVFHVQSSFVVEL